MTQTRLTRRAIPSGYRRNNWCHSYPGNGFPEGLRCGAARLRRTLAVRTIGSLPSKDKHTRIQLQQNTSPGSVWNHHTFGFALRGSSFGGP